MLGTSISIDGWNLLWQETFVASNWTVLVIFLVEITGTEEKKLSSLRGTRKPTAFSK